MPNIKVLADIKGLGAIVEASNNLYLELKQLKEANASLITPEDEAYIRLQTRGKENIGKEYGTKTTAGFEYIKGQLPILNLNSRLTNPDLAEQAVEDNKKESYFHTNSTEEYKQSLKQAEKDKDKEPSKRNVIVLPSRDTFTITDRENWEVLKTALKDQAKPYFEFNGPIRVCLINKDIVDSPHRDGTILTQLWFSKLSERDIRGDWGLDVDYTARGVHKCIKDIAEISRDSPYTQRDVDKYLGILNEIKQGKIKVCDLESEINKVTEFLENLKQ